MDKRLFLKAGLGLGLGIGLAHRAVAQEGDAARRDAERIARETQPPPTVPRRMARTTPLFASPEGYPNAIDAQPEGLWVAEQRTDEGIGVSNDAYLVDWSGKVLRKVKTQSTNTSGMAFGNGRLWMGANSGSNGIWETSLEGRTLSHRQIPLSPSANGGGCHGVAFRDGKLYFSALRLRGILRVDAATWTPEFLIPIAASRIHGIAILPDGKSLWVVTASSNTDPDAPIGLSRYDLATGALIETAQFVPGSSDPHGLTFWRGALYGCDAGIHPGWPNRKSATSGRIFRIEFV